MRRAMRSGPERARAGSRSVTASTIHPSGAAESTGQTYGDITFVHGTTTSPPYANGMRIDLQRVYAIITVGIGIHFDLLGN